MNSVPDSGEASAPPPPKPIRGRLVAIALLAFLSLSYAIYYFTNLPQSVPIRSETAWKAGFGEQLRLHGLAPGTALWINFSGTAAMQLSFPAATQLTVAGEIVRPPAQRPLDASLYNVDRENAEIAIGLVPANEASMMLVLEPRSIDENQLWLRVRADRAAMVVAVGIVRNPSVRRHGGIRFGDELLEEASFTLPAGESFTIALRADQLGAMRTEVGDLEEGVQRLDVSAVETGTQEAKRFERRDLACGAPRGQLLWRFRPDLKLDDCRTDRVSVAKLDITGSGASVALKGSGYTFRDGAVGVWRGIKPLQQNFLVQLMISALFTAFCGAVLYALRMTPSVQRLADWLTR